MHSSMLMRVLINCRESRSQLELNYGCAEHSDWLRALLKDHNSEECSIPDSRGISVCLLAEYFKNACVYFVFQ